RARTEGADGGGGAARRGAARSGFPLNSVFLLFRRGLASWTLVALLILLATGSRFAAAADETVEIASRNGVHTFAVELAVTDEQRARGLMYRRELPEGRGMLFDFHREQPISMWMQNTYISLDMIFIRGDGRILSIAESTEPMSTRVIGSGGAARAVLEVIGGTAKKLGIRPGDRVGHSIFRSR
ncbi:MAG: DUF192 domain-containing protein, partial [Sphingomicrobium sp.]